MEKSRFDRIPYTLVKLLPDSRFCGQTPILTRGPNHSSLGEIWMKKLKKLGGGNESGTGSKSTGLQSYKYLLIIQLTLWISITNTDITLRNNGKEMQL